MRPGGALSLRNPRSVQRFAASSTEPRLPCNPGPLCCPASSCHLPPPNEIADLPTGLEDEPHAGACRLGHRRLIVWGGLDWIIGPCSSAFKPCNILQRCRTGPQLGV